MEQRVSGFPKSCRSRLARKHLHPHYDRHRALQRIDCNSTPFVALTVEATTLAALAINLILGTPAAFIYARYAFRGKKQSFMFLILCPLVPTAALITPIYMMIQAMGLVGSKLAIIAMHATRALPFTVLILSVFFRKMPKELFEAAAIDGCTRLQAFLLIAVPLALAPMAATGLFAFMLSYAEFMFAHVLSGEASSRPASVVMAALARNPDVSWSLLNTGIFIAMLPTLVLVVMVWRYVLSDLTRVESKK